MGSIFNIAGCTVALLCHFAANTTAHKDLRQLHRLLLNALRDMPREIRLRDLRRVEGHCYVVEIDDDLPNDRLTASTIVLFEDRKSLRQQHFRDARKIASEGLGTYQHFDRAIFFSTSDNTSPLVNGRKYVAIHCLSSDPEAFQQLFDWKKSANTTGAARLFAMLRILCPRHFSYAAGSGDGPDVSISGVRLAIDREARLRLAADSMSVCAVAGNDAQWDFEIAALATADAPDAHWNLRGRIDLSPNAVGILLSLEIDGPAGLSLSFEHDSIGTMAIKLGRLRVIRPAMLAWFGDAAALDDWAASVVRLITNQLSDGGFGLSLDRDGLSTFAQMLSEEGMEQSYELTIRNESGRRNAELKRVMHGG